VLGEGQELLLAITQARAVTCQMLNGHNAVAFIDEFNMVLNIGTPRDRIITSPVIMPCSAPPRCRSVP
jgi:hypothetical protein